MTRASVGRVPVDFYLESEYVRSSVDPDGSDLYPGSELGFRPFEWLRIGVAGQRTYAQGDGRDIQYGSFVQMTWRRVTVGDYGFDPGSSDQIVVGLIGVTL